MNGIVKDLLEMGVPLADPPPKISVAELHKLLAKDRGLPACQCDECAKPAKPAAKRAAMPAEPAATLDPEQIARATAGIACPAADAGEVCDCDLCTAEIDAYTASCELDWMRGRRR